MANTSNRTSTGDRTPRLKDVAEMANVSLSAASRILRGDVDRFGADTCERVIEASKKLGWRRNLLVDGMQTGRTRTIGVMIPPVDPCWVQVLYGIHATLAQEDYLPITVWPNSEELVGERETDGIELINRLLGRRVEAMILWPPSALAYYDHFPELRDRVVPVVTIEHCAENKLGDTVTTHEENATRTVAEHLLELGHKRIAYLVGSELPSWTWATIRKECFNAVLDGTPGVEHRSWEYNRDAADAERVITEMLRSDLRPTAVLTATDCEARDVYNVAAKLGVRIPEELSVVGYRDLDFASNFSPPLTSVRQRPREIGRRAASLVLERLKGSYAQESGFVDLKIEADLIVRGSTGPLPEA